MSSANQLNLLFVKLVIYVDGSCAQLMFEPITFIWSFQLARQNLPLL